MERYKKWRIATILLDNSFDVLLTFDKNLQHQQNFSKYTLTVFVLAAKINQYIELTKLTPKIKEYLDSRQMPVGSRILSPIYPLLSLFLPGAS
jgi:hypothetical protein